MTIEKLLETVPDFAKDIRLNVNNLFTNLTQSGLTERQFYGIALAVAFSLKHDALIQAIQFEAGDALDQELIQASKLAAILMAMTNIYYRATHLAEDSELARMPANLRMNAMNNPGVPKIDFELFALAVSALNGCGMCISSHVKQMLSHDVGRLGIQSALRITATLNAMVLAMSLQ